MDQKYHHLYLCHVAQKPSYHTLKPHGTSGKGWKAMLGWKPGIG
jgi:hypothetical protein